MSDPFFRMTLHLASGRDATFHQMDEADVRHNVPLVAPDSVFERPVLIVAGAHRTTSFRTERIVRIELDTTENIQWSFARQLEECELLDDEAFRRAHDAVRDRPRDQKRIAGSRFEELVELRDVCGEVYHVRIAGVAQHSAARLHVTEDIVQAPYLYARRNSTHVLFNPKNLTTVALFPGPKEVPYDALKAHHVE